MMNLKKVETSTRGLSKVYDAWYPPREECEDVARCSLECWPLSGGVN